MLPKQALDVHLPDRAPTEATIQAKLMFPKYAPHDIIAEQTPSEVLQQASHKKTFMPEPAPIDISGEGGGGCH